MFTVNRTHIPESRAQALRTSRLTDNNLSPKEDQPAATIPPNSSHDPPSSPPIGVNNALRAIDRFDGVILGTDEHANIDNLVTVLISLNLDGPTLKKEIFEALPVEDLTQTDVLRNTDLYRTILHVLNEVDIDATPINGFFIQIVPHDDAHVSTSSRGFLAL